MPLSSEILRDIPLFAYCSGMEAGELGKAALTRVIKAGQSIDLGELDSLNIVSSGVMEALAPGKSGSVNFTRGAWFGNIPFMKHPQRGRIRALADSEIVSMESAALYRIFLRSFKLLKTYLRVAEGMGLCLSAEAGKYSFDKSRVIAVSSAGSGDAANRFSAALGKALSGSGRTLVLDLAESGKSLASVFGLDTPPPLCEKKINSPDVFNDLDSRIVSVSGSLGLLNVSSGSRVKTDPDILPSLAVLLLRDYDYLVLSLPGRGSAVFQRGLDSADIVFALYSRERELDILYDLFDAALTQGQRLYYVRNGTPRRGKAAPGDLSFYAGESAEPAAEDAGAFAGIVLSGKKALVLETAYLDSIFYAQFLSALSGGAEAPGLVYSSSLSYIVAALYCFLGGGKEFLSTVRDFFSLKRINTFLDISFPGEHLFKIGALEKYCGAIFGGARAENLGILPQCMLADSSGGRRIFSSGYLKDLCAASFAVAPVFEMKQLAGGEYCSGYPFNPVHSGDILRSGPPDITLASVNNVGRLLPGRGKVPGLYYNFIEYWLNNRRAHVHGNIPSKIFSVDCDENVLDSKKIIAI